MNNPDKVGVDAGTLCGEPPVGVVATDDLDALVALRTDWLAYYGDGIARPAEAVADMCRFLETGTNVVTTSLNQLVYPPPPRQSFVIHWPKPAERAPHPSSTTEPTPGSAATSSRSHSSH